MDLQTVINGPYPVTLSRLAQAADANIFSNEKLEDVPLYNLLNANWEFDEEKERFRRTLAHLDIDVFTMLPVQTLRHVIIKAWQLEEK